MVRGSKSHNRQEVAPSPSPHRTNNHRRSENRETSGSRSNRGSGTRSSGASSRVVSETRSGASTATREKSLRNNHGSDTRSSAAGSTTSATRETFRANRGSGTRNRTSTVQTENRSANRISHSVSRTTRERQRVSDDRRNRDGFPRANHGMGTHRAEDDRGSLARCNVWKCLCDCFFGVFSVIAAVLCCKLCNLSRRSSSLRDQHRRGERQSWWSPSWAIPGGGMLFSVLLFLVLVRNSTMENLVPIDSSSGNIRTMFAGETHLIQLPILTQSVHIEVIHDPPTSRGLRAAVYKSSSSRNCPPLSGPRVELQHDSELDLEGDGFVYDYYNLNPGSSVSVWLDQLDGGTYFYLLHGYQALRDIQTGVNVDPNHWERIALVKVHNTDRGQAYYMAPTNGEWDYDNIYTLVYDNQSTHRVSSVDVETDIVLTTHDLHGYDPACDYMRTGDACRVAANRADCIIVEAFAVNDKDLQEEEEERLEVLLNKTTDSGTGTISLSIQTSRDWKKITIYSSIPLAISFVIYFAICLSGCLCNRNERIDEISTEPLLSSADNSDDGLEEGDMSSSSDADRPPPTAPHFVETPPEASAPLQAAVEQQQTEGNVVVIPPEDVQVCPVAPDGKLK